MVDKISRRLDGGVLPILEGTVVDDDVTYELTAFVTLESSPLTSQTVKGTHFLVADGHGAEPMFTKEQQTQYDALLPEEMNRSEETLLCMRLVAVNRASIPRYAFFRNMSPNLGLGKRNLLAMEPRFHRFQPLVNFKDPDVTAKPEPCGDLQFARFCGRIVEGLLWFRLDLLQFRLRRTGMNRPLDASGQVGEMTTQVAIALVPVPS